MLQSIWEPWYFVEGVRILLNFGQAAGRLRKLAHTMSSQVVFSLPHVEVHGASGAGGNLLTDGGIRSSGDMHDAGDCCVASDVYQAQSPSTSTSTSTIYSVQAPVQTLIQAHLLPMRANGVRG
jgi:hypothetical protein